MKDKIVCLSAQGNSPEALDPIEETFDQGPRLVVFNRSRVSRTPFTPYAASVDRRHSARIVGMQFQQPGLPLGKEQPRLDVGGLLQCQIGIASARAP